jgi:hypothetical protein
MLSKTPLFHRYVESIEHLGPSSDENAAHFIRNICVVESRSQIISGTHAGERFLTLYDDFMRWRDADVFVEPA